MAVYVDDMRAPYGRMIMCHLMSDTSLGELHAFAQKIGMKRSWFQNGSAPHYDLSLMKRKEAVKEGAVEISCSTPEWRRVYNDAKKLKEK